MRNVIISNPCRICDFNLAQHCLHRTRCLAANLGSVTFEKMRKKSLGSVGRRGGGKVREGRSGYSKHNFFFSPYDTCIKDHYNYILIGPRQANLVLIAYASSEGSGEPAHPRSLARTFAARSYKQ